MSSVARAVMFTLLLASKSESRGPMEYNELSTVFGAISSKIDASEALVLVSVL
jgi:hypothetical protein